MKKNFILKLVILAIMFLPVCVHAENKIYFEVDESNIAPGNIKKINIKVDSDNKFTKVNFDLITTSIYVGFYSVDFSDQFVRNAVSTTGSSYELEAKTPMPSGTIIGSVTLKAKQNSPIGSEGYIRLIKSSITSGGLIEVPAAQVKMTVSNEKSKNNNLLGLSSNLADLDFNKDVLEYTVSVKNNVDLFDLVATPEDNTATVEISDQSLTKPSNIIKVSVKAEDGTEKVYKVTVNKKKDKVITTTKKSSQKKENKGSEGKAGWSAVLVLLSAILIFDIFYIKRKK